MTLNIRSSGSWVSKTSLSVRSAGSWVSKTLAFKRVAGVWQAFLQALVRLDSWTQSNTNALQSIVEILTSPSTQMLYQVNGSNVSSFAWVLSGSVSDYECRVTVLSGALTTGGTGGGWISMSSFTNTGLIANSAIGNNKSVTFTMEIRQASTGYIMASAEFSLSARYT